MCRIVSVFAVLITAAAPEPVTNDQTPRLGGVRPPGAIVGNRVVWTLDGQNLGRIDRIDIEGNGVSARIIRASETAVAAEIKADPLAAEGFRAIRAEGPDGISNLAMIRVDHLRQIVEHEPNDSPDQATPLPSGSVAVGELTQQDLDHYSVQVQQGVSLQIEIEARRLGLAIAPVLTVMTPDGRALAQGRETPGLDGDCRLVFRCPVEGTYLIQVRDNLYGGTDGACYRLRVTRDEPYATALFPLGGRAGRSLTVRASGGNLRESVAQTIELPDGPGTVVNVPPFRRGERVFLSPGRIVVGADHETDEQPDRLLDVPQTGITINGRIDSPGEVDRHRIRVRRAEKVCIKLIAATLGSWLDSVVTVRDAAGRILAENDDAREPDRMDSRVDFQAGPDQELTVEVADRFGQGGQEFGYRLLIGPERADFQVSTRWLRPLLARDFDLSEPNGPPGTGALTLKAGSSISLLCEIRSEGRTGPIVLTAQGLPRGVAAAVVTIRPQSDRTSGKISTGQAQGVLVLRADRGAEGVSGQFRIVARATPEPGRVVEHLASESLRIDHARSAENPVRPVIREVTEFPIRVVAP